MDWALEQSRGELFLPASQGKSCTLIEAVRCEWETQSSSERSSRALGYCRRTKYPYCSSLFVFNCIPLLWKLGTGEFLLGWVRPWGDGSSIHIKACKGLIHAQAVLHKDLILPSISWRHFLDSESCWVAANIIVHSAEEGKGIRTREPILRPIIDRSYFLSLSAF